MKVIFDCDNTMGVHGCDINGGLALLYLLGKENIQICGITTTYGNSKIDIVHSNTVNMLQELGRTAIPIIKGSANRYSFQSIAAEYLVEMVNTYPGEISILATGVLTNLYGAYVIDPGFFDKVGQLVIMGGVFQEIIINGTVIDEWNFSSDPTATLWVLREGKNLSLITQDRGLELFVSYDRFVHNLGSSKFPIGRYIFDRSKSWLEHNKENSKLNGFYTWDLLAAAYLTNPHFFNNQEQSISLNYNNLTKGLVVLEEKEVGHKVNFPVANDIEAIIKDFYKSWYSIKYDENTQLKGAK
ncbi:MAG: nucleoside hydrolase [Desulfitobacterium sp.]|nr:nucleoside hydrolase [Desulfitobacterium sp.]